MGGKRIHCDVPLNRVEGDLEVRVAVENDRVAEAWSRGTLFRGFERMLVDRAPMDSLVVTPRICGICSTTHLAAAARALDQVAGVTPPDNAIRMRNAALMAEQIQSDLRQSLLMFMVDFANSAYADHSLADEARRRYAPVGGQHHPPGARSVAAVRETKHILELVALVGGQWPHTSFMVPGGVVYKAEPRSLQQGRHIVKALRRWYEDQVLGCSLERWAAVRSVADLDAWLAESAAHRESDAGFLMRFGREAGLDRLGAGPGTFLSYGNLPLPAETAVAGRAGRFVPAGFARGADTGPFHEGHIAEHTAFSWYQGDPGGHHPWSGRTEPLMEDGGERYSWAKAPRYRGAPAETGPLAERILAGDGLFTDWVGRDGPNVLARQLARLTRPATLFGPLEAWLEETLAALTPDESTAQQAQRPIMSPASS